MGPLLRSSSRRYGRLVLLWNAIPNEGYVRREELSISFSEDDGKTWAQPYDITADVKGSDWGWYATGPGVGIQLTREKYRGRLVIPCDHREKRDGKWIKMSHVFYSDDHGRSWAEPLPITPMNAKLWSFTMGD